MKRVHGWKFKHDQAAAVVRTLQRVDLSAARDKLAASELRREGPNGIAI